MIFFFFKQKTAYEISACLVGSEMCIRDSRYVMKPMLPIRRDSPKKAITLILAVLLGGMVGAGIVLGRNALRNYNAK